MEDDVEAAQIYHLKTIIQRLRKCPEANFSMTFPFSLESSDLAGAPHFLIHVMNGECCLRLAGGDDLYRAAWRPRPDELHQYGLHNGKVRYMPGMSYALEGLPKESPYVQLNKLVGELTAQDLLIGLRCFLLVDVMFS
jgi:hypothetical protein